MHVNFVCSLGAPMILPESPRASQLCTSQSKSRHMTAEASAAFGVPPDATTVSELAVFPFKGGMLKTLLFPPLIPLNRPISVPSGIVQVKAPTHGCTFQPTSNVTFVRSDRTPLISVIWYFGLLFLRRIIPGSSSGSCFFVDGLALLDFFEGVVAVLNNCIGLKGWDWLREFMIVSQMMA